MRRDAQIKQQHKRHNCSLVTKSNMKLTFKLSSTRFQQLTPDGKRAAAAAVANAGIINENSATTNAAAAVVAKPRAAMEEDFFDMLTKSQSKRMDDQRCSLKVLGRSATIDATSSTSAIAAGIRKPLVQQNNIVGGSGNGGSAKPENR